MALPIALYSTAQVRSLDAYAINELKIPGYTLMKRAGEAALRYLRTRWPDGAPHRHRLRWRQQRRRRLCAGALCPGRGPDREGAERDGSGGAARGCASGTRGPARQRCHGAPLRRQAARRGRGHRRCAARHGPLRGRARRSRTRHPRHQRVRAAGVRARCALRARCRHRRGGRGGGACRGDRDVRGPEDRAVCRRGPGVRRHGVLRRPGACARRRRSRRASRASWRRRFTPRSHGGRARPTRATSAAC